MLTAHNKKLAEQGIRLVAASRPSLPEVIYEALRNAIVSGSLPPGRVLRQEELAGQFNASRVPLREALQQLQAEGLVVLRPRRGYAVAVLDGLQLLEILQLRILVEGYAGYVATLVRSRTDIKALEACVRDMDRLPTIDLSSAQIARWSMLNQRFHDILIASAARPHLQQIAGNLRSKIEAYIRMEISFVDCLHEAHVEHHEILEAFRAGDAPRVSILCRLHAEATARRFVRALSERGLVTGIPEGTVTDLGPAAMLDLGLAPSKNALRMENKVKAKISTPAKTSGASERLATDAPSKTQTTTPVTGKVRPKATRRIGKAAASIRTTSPEKIRGAKRVQPVSTAKAGLSSEKE